MVLRACYFCGSPGGGLDTYPVVPDRVTPEDGHGDPERVVLCPDCHAKLERVLDGVLAAVDEDPTVVEPSAADADQAADAGPAPDADGFSAEITFGDADTGGGAGDGSSDAGPEERNATGDADAGGDADGAGPDTDVDVVPDSPPASGADAEATDDADATTVDGDEPVADAEGESDESGDEGADESTGDSSGSLRGLGNSGTSQYRQALRLLQNREFPMPRSDLVDVMSSAYDLTRDESDRLVDFAVERGLVEDDGGVLRRD
ncbi:MAG: hypothetical protein ABEH78_06295 [Haloferacaceae archaeon]